MFGVRKEQAEDSAARPFGICESVFLMEEFVVDVGPELFKDERSAIDCDTCNPALISFSKGALRAGVVKARDARGRACPASRAGQDVLRQQADTQDGAGRR